MDKRTIETDYLVVGCGATGMAFTDELITHSDADVVMIDARPTPGGHWNDVYSFVRLHQPSAYYGVNSMPLGGDRLDSDELNRGMYERATGVEICAYYRRVMEERLLASGRVRYFPMCRYLEGHRFASLTSGDVWDVKVRRRLVDATYLEPAIPATHAPPFEIAPEARCVAPGELPPIFERAVGHVVIGAGKTAMDVCLWLLEMGVGPEDIRWIRPREAWVNNRAFAQPRDLVWTILEGVSLQVEAAARAESVEDLFARLEAFQQLLRLDEAVTPTMYRAPTASTSEIERLRRISNVERLGRVRRIGRDRIALDGGTIPTSPQHLHIHCAAPGLNPAPAVPIFSDDRIVPQPVRTGLVPFNSALIGFIEATRGTSGEKNRLCPPNRLPDLALDWVRGMVISTNADYQWSKQPDIRDWLERARLNPGAGLRERAADPRVQRASRRYAENVRPALEKLQRFLSASEAGLPPPKPTV